MYDRVKELCEKRGISISKLEQKAELSKGTISRWRVADPKQSSLAKVAEVLETTVSYLTTGKESKNIELSPELAELSIELLKDKKAQDTFKMFMQLSDSRKEDIFDIVKMFYEKEK